MDWKQKREKMDKELKEKIVPLIKGSGFKGSYPHFRKLNVNVIEIIGFQFSQWGPQFYIEVGIAPNKGITVFGGKYISPEKIKHYHTANRIRVGQSPFDYENEDFEKVIHQADDALNEAQKWLDQQV